MCIHACTALHMLITAAILVYSRSDYNSHWPSAISHLLIKLVHFLILSDILSYSIYLTYQ